MLARLSCLSLILVLTLTASAVEKPTGKADVEKLLKEIAQLKDVLAETEARLKQATDEAEH